MTVGTATLDEPEQGLPDTVLDTTDVLTWWGHLAHDEVPDALVERVHQRVLAGMGLIVLHSGHYSKIFKRLMGSSCSLKWREADDRERLWVTAPGHPITVGIGEYFDIEREEMYGEFFDIPQPDTLVFLSYPGFFELVYWRRGISQRLLLYPRARKNLLLPTRT